MATKVYTTLVDDLTGDELHEGEGQKIEFGFRGRNYTIDLSNDNATEFDDVMGRYVAVASPAPAPAKVGRGRAAKGTTSARNVDTAAARDWARENGHEVSARGRVPAKILDLYHAAQAN